ncbi:TIGR02301 family protein [Pannonibacter tanglangensis]|nr:TIGR02301 family protein [Pannonibacter sp. XCT-34]
MTSCPVPGQTRSRILLQTRFQTPWLRRRPACLRSLALAMALLVPALPPATATAQEPLNEPPYERQLLRLSEILGALHFLRPLCARADEPGWRDRMETLLAAEAADEARKRRFIERFNQGYRGFAAVYHSCTPAAREAMTGYISEGSSLIRDVTARYSR